MTLIQMLTDADAITISRATLDYSGDHIGSGTLGPYFDLCPIKAPGTLSFSFDVAAMATQLGILNVNLMATFSGVPLGTDRVRWTADQSMDVYVSDPGVTIERVRADITTALTELSPPVLSTLCGTSARLYSVFLQTVGASSITITGHKRFWGVNYGFTITCTNIAIIGVAGAPSTVTVEIKAPQDGCGAALTEGASVSLWALTLGVPQGYTESMLGRYQAAL